MSIFDFLNDALERLSANKWIASNNDFASIVIYIAMPVERFSVYTEEKNVGEFCEKSLRKVEEERGFEIFVS